jgi:hypothetical protein
MSRTLSIALLAALTLTACATDGHGPPPPPIRSEASIPFLTNGQVRTFVPDRDGQGVFIQNSRRDWYYVRFFTRCNELPFAPRIGFQTFGNSSTLSRGDTIIAGRDRCRIASITRSGPPPGRAPSPDASPTPAAN